MSTLARLRYLFAALVACLLLFALGAGTAAAESIAFIKESNVWLANGDGSAPYQVTLDGTAENPYLSPSQADDGTIVAARKSPNGGPLYRMRQNGEVINEIPVGAMQAGPFSPQVSPDGSMVAFEHVFSRYINGYLETSSDVRFTRADGSTPDGAGEVGRGAGAPSWIDSGRAFVGINAIASTVVPGGAPVQWWSDYDHQPDYFSFGQSVEDGEVAANGYIAVVRGEGTTATIQLYRSSGSFTQPPVPACTLTGPSPGPAGEEFHDPTFSPGGTAVAWQEGDGVWVMDLPANCKEGHPRLLIPGASEPDWGPAAVSPAPRSAVEPDGKKGKRKRGRGKALAKGVKLSLKAPARGRFTATARFRGKLVGRATRKVAHAGQVSLPLRFSKAGLKVLSGRERARVKVLVRFAPRGGGAVRTSRLVLALKR